jgi:hypothetical protein
MSQLEVDKIIPQSGTTLTIGDSGDTITVASGATLTGDLNASNLTSGTVPDARITGAYTGITNLTMSGDLTVDTSTLYVDSSNNKVGIGTAFPNNYASSANTLVVGNTSSQNGITIVTSTSETGSLQFADGATGNQSYQGRIRYDHSASLMSFHVNNGSERMRIDSSGNLLVATTNSIPGVGNTDTGISLRNNNGGSLAVSRSGDRAGYFNRNTSDGDIVQFRKDGTAVGSIGIVNTNNLFIQGDSTNSGLQCGTNNILPVQNGANADNTIDLGLSTIRWKDLYLGGGLYVGGTGTANKLDDYEEGTWTPSFNFSELTGFSGSITTTDATYTKIGNFVSLNVGFSFPGSSGSLSVGDLCTVSGGLPFTQKGSTYGGTGGNFAFSVSNTANISIQPRSGGFRAFITSIVGSPTRVGGAMRITYNYQTT